MPPAGEPARWCSAPSARWPRWRWPSRRNRRSGPRWRRTWFDCSSRSQSAQPDTHAPSHTPLWQLPLEAFIQWLGTQRAKGRTRDQLYAEAQHKNVKGRSRMNKEQLQRAVDR